jgi:hypothetical protein
MHAEEQLGIIKTDGKKRETIKRHEANNKVSSVKMLSFSLSY